MIALIEWITIHGYVTNKDDLWYQTSVYPRVYLKHEQLIETYENSSL
jgi:hypothetical protein